MLECHTSTTHTTSRALISWCVCVCVLFFPGVPVVVSEVAQEAAALVLAGVAQEAEKDKKQN